MTNVIHSGTATEFEEEIHLEAGKRILSTTRFPVAGKDGEV